jgi:hypothetical protein
MTRFGSERSSWLSGAARATVGRSATGGTSSIGRAAGSTNRFPPAALRRSVGGPASPATRPSTPRSRSFGPSRRRSLTPGSRWTPTASLPTGPHGSPSSAPTPRRPRTSASSSARATGRRSTATSPPEHRSCDPAAHASLEPEDYLDNERCPSCQGREWVAVQGFGGTDTGNDADVTMCYLRVPCGCTAKRTQLIDRCAAP